MPHILVSKSPSLSTPGINYFISFRSAAFLFVSMVCLNCCPCREPWWMCWAHTLWSSVLWTPLDTHWLLAASKAHKDSLSFPNLLSLSPSASRSPFSSCSDSQIHTGIKRAIEQIGILYLFLCMRKLCRETNTFLSSSSETNWCCCSLFRLMMTFTNSEQFQITSIIHPGTYVQHCAEFSLYCWVHEYGEKLQMNYSFL